MLNDDKNVLKYFESSKNVFFEFISFGRFR
jgi:hypothetical protein